MSVTRVMMSADTVGGVFTYAVELARALARHGVRTLLATLGAPPSADRRQAIAQVPGMQWRHGDHPLEWMHGAMTAQDAAGRWLLELAQAWQPDVVHLNHFSHGHLPWPAPSLVVAHSCVLSWHEHVRGSAADASWNSYRQALTRGLRQAPLVVAPTAAMLADIQRLYGPLQATAVIHNGRCPDDFPALSKRDVILCAGRLWDEAKNVRALAQVAPHLRWPVHAAGEAAHPQGGAVGMPGIVPLGNLAPAAMAAAYGHAAIYALPARYEPFGLSVLEAAMAGCALVLSDIASLRELWHGAAVFVEPDDSDALTGAIDQLIERPAMRRLWARRARQRARRYTSERMADGYLRAYAQLANREAAPCTS